MKQATITRPPAPIKASIQLPRSKSVSNRALICASFAGDLSCVRDLSDAEDTRILHQLVKEGPRVMHCGLGGTTFRFLLARACVQEGEEHVITGEPRLLERPHDELIGALRSLGAEIERRDEGYRVRGRKLGGGSLAMHSPISSQYISALMMIAPMMEEGLRIEWQGRRRSKPYVAMTAKVMAHFGIAVKEQSGVIIVPPAQYHAKELAVPPDWSAAAFWYEIVALAAGSDVLLEGLHADGLQGDEAAREHWSGRVESIASPEGTRLVHVPGRPKWNQALYSNPDLFQPLAATLATCPPPNVVFVPATVALKETDRMAAMERSLTAMGLEVFVTFDREQFSASGTIMPVPPPIDPTGDHRMAMAIAPLALVCDRLTILDPDVVKKSYPGYWDDLRKAGFGVEFR